MAEIQYKNIYLFSWPEKFNLDRELSRWVSSFSEKFGKNSVNIYTSENRDEWAAKQSIFGGWLFCTKKLTVIKWIPVSAKKEWFSSSTIEWFTEYIITNPQNIPADNLLIFVSYEPDKRWRFFKFLQKDCNFKEFTKLTPIQLKQFVKSELENITISDKTVEKFINTVWDDLYRIDTECDKLKSYCQAKSTNEITDDIVDKVTFGMTENDVFTFLNLAYKDKIQAVKYLQKIQDEDVNRNMFAWALYSQLRTSIIINRCYQSWIKKADEIAQASGLNPRAVFANLNKINDISKNWKELENMYKLLVQTDANIKSGKNDETEFWLNTKKAVMKFN